MDYILPDLPYQEDALEPYLDVESLHIHHDKHHRSYVESLNRIFEPYPDLKRPVEELLASIPYLPLEIADDVRNNGGGHANHTLFWTLMTPLRNTEPSTELLAAIQDRFGSFEDFRRKFSQLAGDHFASGWAWLCADTKGQLNLLTTKDHDSPITQGLIPLLVLDLWEHAYYLKYKNEREPFIEAFWGVVNWPEVSQRWDEFQKTGNTSREWREAG